jgi:hypothetical protein
MGEMLLTVYTALKLIRSLGLCRHNHSTTAYKTPDSSHMCLTTTLLKRCVAMTGVQRYTAATISDITIISSIQFTLHPAPQRADHCLLKLVEIFDAASSDGVLKCMPGAC